MWLSAFPVPALSMLCSPCFSLYPLFSCLPGTGPVFVAEVPTVLYIHWNNRVLKKKKSSIEGENFRLCIDFYMRCWVSLFDHRVPPGVSAWGIPLVPHTQRQIRKVSCLACHRPEYSYILTHMHIYINHQRRLLSEVNCENGAAMSPLLVWNVELTHSVFIYMQNGNHLHISEIQYALYI